MKKIIYILSILSILALISLAFNSNADTNNDSDFSTLQQTDDTFPDIRFDINDLKKDYIFRIIISEPDTFISSYKIIHVYGTQNRFIENITFTTQSVTEVTYEVVTNDTFERGAHNSILVFAYNFAHPDPHPDPSPFPTYKQGGGGGGGGGFCQNPTCWCPTGSPPKNTQEEENPFSFSEYNDTSVDIFFNLSCYRNDSVFSVRTPEGIFDHYNATTGEVIAEARINSSLAFQKVTLQYPLEKALKRSNAIWAGSIPLPGGIISGGGAITYASRKSPKFQNWLRNTGKKLLGL